jgi:hypothetical protein
LKKVAILLLAEPTLALKVALVQRLEVIPVRVPVGMWVEVVMLVGVEVVLTPVLLLKPPLKV